MQHYCRWWCYLDNLLSKHEQSDDSARWNCKRNHHFVTEYISSFPTHLWACFFVRLHFPSDDCEVNSCSETAVQLLKPAVYLSVTVMRLRHIATPSSVVVRRRTLHDPRTLCLLVSALVSWRPSSLYKPVRFLPGPTYKESW